MSGIINSIKKVASSGTLQRNAGVPEFSPEMRFSIEPLPGDSGFSQWHSAMKMVSQLPEGIPLEFRKRLWLSLADKHLTAKGINWALVEKNCFSEWSHPSDAELGVQIVKDLHRTGCSLFCGENGQENQALLKRVLLAYARWNKAVGYCQGFNMLAALMLQVTERCESDALKLMIYLIEGVLPESYFADSLRGLSVDMAVFRELLRTKLPKLSRHLDNLQAAAKEGTTSYEPPLTNVFTMQWFLTLFCNCLPQPTVLRVWDLILLEGNEILLRTSLAIWQVLAERIMTVKSADEFYCIMGVLMREILEYDLINANTLIKGIVTIGPLTELKTLREHYLYNINPWGSAVTTTDPNKSLKLYHKDKLLLDIGILKKQYTRLKQRQRQAHIIFNSAVARQTTRPAPVAMNHLLLGRRALVPAKRIGPPKGTIPPVRQTAPKTILWKDTRRDSSSSSSSSSDTELCDDPGHHSSDDEKYQLPHDNPINEQSDTALMNKDNILCEKTNSVINCTDAIDLNLLTMEVDSKDVINLTTEDNYSSLNLVTFEVTPEDVNINCETNISNESQISSSVNNIFDTPETKTSEVYDYDELPNLERSDSIPSEDISFDFERFLQERVKTMKEKTFTDDSSPEDTSEQERVKYARKNSQLALQIIQENSLILHRILQCQSRYTPSPPPLGDDSINFFVENETVGTDFLNLKNVVFEENDVTPTNDERRVVGCEESSGVDDYVNLEDGLGLKNKEFSLIDLTEISDRNDDNGCGEVHRTTSLDNLILKYNLITKNLEIPVEKAQVVETPLHKTQLYESPVYDTSLSATSLSATAVYDTSLSATSLSATPVYESPVYDTSLSATPVYDTSLSATSLSATPVYDTSLSATSLSATAVYESPVYDTSLSATSLSATAVYESPVYDTSLSATSLSATSVSATPVYETLVSETPVYEIPVYESPVYESPVYESPVYESPAVFEIPVDEIPVDETPKNMSTDKTEIEEVDFNLIKYRQKLGSPISEELSECSSEPTMIEIAKNSKYNSILEYSKNLDERFNNLILNKSSLKFKEASRLNSSMDVPGSENRDFPTSSTSFPNLLSRPRSSENIRYDINSISEVDNCGESEELRKSPDEFLSSFSKDNYDSEEGSLVKSSNRIYNPFPVNISSRQNKEVALKLGLYKK